MAIFYHVVVYNSLANCNESIEKLSEVIITEINNWEYMAVLFCAVFSAARVLYACIVHTANDND